MRNLLPVMPQIPRTVVRNNHRRLLLQSMQTVWLKMPKREQMKEKREKRRERREKRDGPNHQPSVQ